MQRAYEELKAAIYDRRVETYEYPPLVEDLTTLALEETHAGIAPAAGNGSPVPPRPLAEAVAGVVHGLVRQEERGH